MPISRKPGTPYWSAPGATLHLGDVRGCLRRLPTRSVHCCVTSPPYWGLRDYRTGTWEGGSAECDHMQPTGVPRAERQSGPYNVGKGGATHEAQEQKQYAGQCKKCGALRTDQQLGMEDHADCLGWATGKLCGECYVCHMVEVFAEVRRVLRDDGTLWLNLGDTFDNGQGMIPAAVAMALRANGWKLVQDIIWYSPNKMPESVTNRCTKSHEHIFLLAKGNDYYYDSVAIEEEMTSKPHAPGNKKLDDSRNDHDQMSTVCTPNGAKNKRDVWIVSTQGYPGAHFATFSPKLITPCIFAGTSEAGCCAGCSRPYERIVAKTGEVKREKVEPITLDGDAGYGGHRTRRGLDKYHDVQGKERDRSFDWSRNGKPGTGSTLDSAPATKQTVGWQKMCGCQTNDVVPCTVLDPFVGSGTTVATALELGRHGIGIDLSEQYLKEHAIPRIEAAMRGEKVGRKVVPVMPLDAPPIPSVLP